MSKPEGNADASGRDESAPGKKDNADIYENRGTKKIVRLVTVMAYMFSVSFVAIVLSAYYLFLWEPPNPRLIHRAHHLRAEPRIEFLLAEAPRLHSFSAPRPQEVSGHPVFQSLDGNGSPGGEVTGDFYPGDSKDQDRLDDTLLRLRNSLIERFWRRGDREEYPPGTGRPTDAGKFTELEKMPTKLPVSKFGNTLEMPAEASKKTINPGDDNATSPIPEFSISGEEAVKGETSPSGESSSKDTFRHSNPNDPPTVRPFTKDPKYNSAVNDPPVILDERTPGPSGEPRREEGGLFSSEGDEGDSNGPIGTGGTKTNDSIVANIYESLAAAGRASSRGSFHDRSINTESTMANNAGSLVNGSYGDGVPPVSGERGTKDLEDPKDTKDSEDTGDYSEDSKDSKNHPESKDIRGLPMNTGYQKDSTAGSYGDGIPVRTQGSSLQVEYTRPTGFPGAAAPASVKPTNLAINSEDTQAPRTAMRPATPEVEHLPGPEATTRRQMSLLAILTQIATTEIPSSNSTAPTSSEDFTTDSIPVAKSTEGIV